MNVGRVRAWASVLWPAFLAAGALVTLVFALVDPREIPGVPDRVGTYTIAFFVFWAVTALACWATRFLVLDDG